MNKHEQKAAIARANGAKSKGPKTPEGKAISSRNALRHGLTSRKILISGLEDETEYKRFKTGIRSHYQPQSVMEAIWVDRLTSCLWRLRRVALEETGMIDATNASGMNGRDVYLPANTERLELMSLYEERLMKQVQAAIKEIDKLKASPGITPSPMAGIISLNIRDQE